MNTTSAVYSIIMNDVTTVNSVATILCCCTDRTYKVEIITCLISAWRSSLFHRREWHRCPCVILLSYLLLCMGRFGADHPQSSIGSVEFNHWCVPVHHSHL